jgi:hypothetical protein
MSDKCVVLCSFQRSGNFVARACNVVYRLEEQLDVVGHVTSVATKPGTPRF